MNLFPVSKLFCRFQPVEGSSFIFICNKDGYLPAAENSVIPLKSLYFIVEPATPIPFSELNASRYYRRIFVFETMLDGTPATRSEVQAYRDRVFKYSQSKGLFAKTITSEHTYHDNEKLIEWIPDKNNILAPIQNLAPEVRCDLNLPYPLEQDDDNIVIFQDAKLAFFGHSSGRYIFTEIKDRYIAVRHYCISDNKSGIVVQFYAEVKYDGQYICRFYLDEDESLKINRDTIIGYPNLQTIKEKIYNFDHNKYVALLKEQNKGFTYAAYQAKKVEQRKAMGLDKFAAPGLTLNEDDEDGGGFFKCGSMSDYMFQQAFEDSYM